MLWHVWLHSFTFSPVIYLLFWFDFCFDMFVVVRCDRRLVCFLSFDMFATGDLFHIVFVVSSRLLSLWPFSTRLTLITPNPGSRENVRNGVPQSTFDIVWHCFSTWFDIVENVVPHCSPQRWRKSHIVMWFVSSPRTSHSLIWYIVQTAILVPTFKIDLWIKGHAEFHTKYWWRALESPCLA